LTRRLAPALAALACAAALPATAAAAPGDIAVADEGNWMGVSGRVLQVGSGGAAAVLAAGAPLSDPWAVAVAADGALLVVDEGSESVFSLDPAGKLDTVASGDVLEDPAGIALAPDGKAYVSDRQRDEVLRLDLATGTLTHVADVNNAMGVAMDKAGRLLVANGSALRRIDPATGAMRVLAQGAPLEDPRDVAVALDGSLFVAGDRQVVRVDPITGAQSLLASGQPLTDPRGIDIQPDGDLVVADGHSHGGSVIRVARATGAQTLLASGGAFRVPSGLAVVGGAGVDASGGGNGDPDGPAAPPPPPPPADPGGGGTPGGGTPGGGIPGPGGTIIVSNPDGTTTVTRPDGTVVTLPAGVTPGTSGIKGIDFAAPFVGKPRLGSTRFRAARHGRAFASVSIGTRIFYTLNEAARVLISVQKYRAPSRVCRRARGSRHRTGTRCRKWISLKGRYAKASVAGVSSVRFRGRLEGRTLKPGRYRFVIRARDGAGNVSKPRRPKFRIVR
jgi:streptogramin lyase